MKHDRFAVPTPVGATTLFVIFAALCLTVFSLLTLSTADAERRLAASAAQAAADYYAADCEAERIFAELRAGKIPPEVTAEGNRCSYVCPISDTLFLHVDLIRTESGWSILQWQAVSENR